MQITRYSRHADELMGLIPSFLIESDPRPAAEQFNDRYSFGGGWRPMDGWKAEHDTTGILLITYPGDPAYRPVAQLSFRAERIWVYPYAWVAIEQADGSVEISRMD